MRRPAIRALPAAWRDHPEYAECRVLVRHALRPTSDWDIDLKTGEILRDFRCLGCKTVVHKSWKVFTGARRATEYEYPEGYKMPGRKRTTGANDALRATIFRGILKQRRRA